MSSELPRTFLAALAAALRKCKIDAVVVGGAAGMLNGTSFPTQAIDLLVRDTPLNRKKLRALAASLGGSGPGEISGLSDTQRIYGAQVQVDILYDRMGGNLKFASVKSRAHREVVESEALLVASLEDVIKSKRAAGRPKDLLALPNYLDTLAVRKKLGLP